MKRKIYAVNESYRLRRMAKLVSSSERVLDVGYADQPNPFLINSEVVGIDLVDSNKPHNYSDVITGDISDPVANSELAGSFDAVIVGEVLEHVENPIGLLKSCFALLCRGGKLVLSTPNPHSPMELLLNICLSRRYYYTEEHLILFPQRWLVRVQEYVGFMDVKLYSGGIPFPGVGLLPFPRAFCYQTISCAVKS